jgi:hypothetical protein
MAKKKGFKFGKSTAEPLSIICEGELEGLEVVVRGNVPSIMLFGGEIDRIRAFVNNILSWSATDENDEPIPATEQTIGQYVTAQQLAQIIQTWTEALTRPSVPLDEQSSDSGI